MSAVADRMAAIAADVSDGQLLRMYLVQKQSTQRLATMTGLSESEVYNRINGHKERLRAEADEFDGSAQ